jgi:hypothetical protein
VSVQSNQFVSKPAAFSLKLDSQGIPERFFLKKQQLMRLKSPRSEN